MRPSAGLRNVDPQPMTSPRIVMLLRRKARYLNVASRAFIELATQKAETWDEIRMSIALDSGVGEPSRAFGMIFHQRSCFGISAVYVR